MEDVADQETREKQHTLSYHFDSMSGGRSREPNSNGFVVQGGPWEQRAPNTASVTEFPSFGRNTEEPQASPISGAWGSRR